MPATGHRERPEAGGRPEPVHEGLVEAAVNRSGRNLGRADRARLTAAKNELRRVFGRKAA